MYPFTITTAVAAAVMVGLASLSAAQAPAKLNPDTATLAKGNNTFAMELFANLRKSDGNLFFSPYSISSALAMTSAGARGKTASDMALALHFPWNGERLHPVFADLIKELSRPGQERKFQLAIANRLWGQKDFGFLPEFVKQSQANYGAGLEELDFAATELARKTINDWVDKETQGRIKDLIGQGDLAADTRLVLTNAIYFKANWAEAFQAAATKKEDFKVGAGKTVKVDMMHHHEFWQLAQTDTFQMLELPYEQRQLSMLILLPRKADGLADLEKQLSANNIQEWLGKMKEHQVSLSLPKFNFTSEFKLGKVLSEMGMASAFGPAADFSGMTTREKLFIGNVIHKAFVAVDEKGTEAAAATAVVMRPTAVQAAPPETFKADHPFVFLIRDNRTGSILFVGRVVNP